jgi:uncharacterized protein (TIRG00374 family)
VNNKKLVISLLIVSVCYLFAFVFLDKYDVLSKINNFSFLDFIILISLFLISIILRYVRWFLILDSQGVGSGFFFGFIRYTSGFLYTATPGKLGELSRVYFYRDTEVKQVNIVSAFIFERTFDIVVVLLLSIFSLLNSNSYLYVVISVCGIVFLVLAGCVFVDKIRRYIKRNIVTDFIFDSLSMIKNNMSIKLALISLLLGFLSWTIISYILIYIMYSLDLVMKFDLEFISIYPIGMLVGALTFIPGGLGTTEMTIAYMLNNFNINILDAFLVAVLARFSTIWMATILGLICSWIVSLRNVEIVNLKSGI